MPKVNVRVRKPKAPTGAVSRTPHTSVYVRADVERLREICKWRLRNQCSSTGAVMTVAHIKIPQPWVPNLPTWTKAHCIKLLEFMDDTCVGIKSRDWSPFINGISFSALSSWLKCRESSRLSLQGWQSRRRMSSADYGVMFHAALEAVYLRFKKYGDPTIAENTTYLEGVAEVIIDDFHEKAIAAGASERERQDIERHGGCLSALLPLYCKHWAADFQGKYQWEDVEGKLYAPCPVEAPVFFKGFVDNTYRLDGGLWIMDTKTRGRIDGDTIASAVNIDLQLTLYAWMVWKITGVAPVGTKFNMIRNPGLKMRKGDTLTQYVERVREDAMKRPDFYFIRFEVPLDGIKELEAFEENAKGMVDDFMQWFYGGASHYSATSACTSGKWPCNFLALCGDGAVEQFKNYNDEGQRR